MAWTGELPDKVEQSLEEILGDVENYEEVYDGAENPSVAQIWTAMARMNERIERLEKLVRAQRKALNEMDVELDLDSEMDRNLQESLKRY
ncbi:MAG: hypothetical protein ABEK01_04640 [Candidatus Nanohaloarchaea archaeon]